MHLLLKSGLQSMRLTDILTAICGIVFGCFITVHINRIMRQYSSSVEDIMVNHTNYSETMNGDATLLLVEREKLLLRLKEINQALNRTYSLQASSAKTISTPLVSKQTTIPVKCKYDFSVYVYEIPKSLRSIQVSEEARINKSLHICQKCILEQFALEYILFDFFTQFCGRTYDPEKADFFYLPIVRDAEYRFALQHFGPRSRTPSDAEEALLLILEKNDSSLWKNLFQLSDKYWRARDGADHIIAMPAPVTNFRHQGSQRGFFHYMIQLSTPIFLSVEYSSEFIREYPFCSIRKNIVMPYPTTDPELFNGKLLKMPLKSSGQQFLRQNSKIENENKSIIINYKERRQYLLYYAGGLHGDCIEVRKAMKQLMNNCSRLANIIPPVRSNQEEREEGFLSSTFCPVPIGDSPSSKRMYDVLNFGCIPVVLSDELVWAFSDETNGPLNHSSFSVKLPQSVVQYNALRSLSHYASRKADFGVLPSGTLLYDLLLRAQKEGADFAAAAKGKAKVYVNPLVQILQRVSEEDIATLRSGAEKAAQYYRYYQMNVSMHAIPTAHHAYPDGYAMDMLAASLQQRKDSGIETIRESCLHERRSRKHAYINRYNCDTDKKDSLIRKKRV